MAAGEKVKTKLRWSGGAWPYLGIALLAHTSWGIYPVLARYLQTVSGLPSMSLLTLANIAPLVIMTAIYRRQLNRTLLTSPTIWLFALIVVGRAVTNVLAARYTLSIYAQLITQSTPFLVILLGATLFKEPIPRYTGTAIFLGLAGALLMLSGNFGQDAAAGRSDWLGILLALASSGFLAFYMLVVRRTAGNRAISSEGIILVQLLAVVLVSGLASGLYGEDWSRYGSLGPGDWLVFWFFSLGVFLLANWGQITALRRLGAPIVSSMMAWRLVSALILGGWLLGERLESGWQGVGALIVLVTITWYLSRQAAVVRLEELEP